MFIFCPNCGSLKYTEEPSSNACDTLGCFSTTVDIDGFKNCGLRNDPFWYNTQYCMYKYGGIAPSIKIANLSDMLADPFHKPISEFSVEVEAGGPICTNSDKRIIYEKTFAWAWKKLTENDLGVLVHVEKDEQLDQGYIKYIISTAPIEKERLKEDPFETAMIVNEAFK